MDASLPVVSVVVVNYNSIRFLTACLNSIAAQDYPVVRTIVVDNASTDGSADLVAREFPDVLLLRSPGNLGYAGGANLGLKRATGNVLCVLNPDVVVAKDWVKEIVSALAGSESAGIAGGKLLYPDGRTIQHAGGILQRPEAATRHAGYGEQDEGQFDLLWEPDFVTGAAIAAKRRVLEELDYFDEQFFPAYFEEPDLCLRAAAAGYKTIYVPTAVATHYESATVDMRSTEYYFYHHRNRLRFVAKHWKLGELLEGFLSSETMRLRDTMPEADRLGSDRAYREAAMNGRNESERSSVSGNEGRAFLETPSLRSYFGSSRHDADILRGKWLVKEQPFHSETPVVGRLVVFLREKILNLASRWYVQPILQQQVEFNQATVQSIDDVLDDVERQAEDTNSVLTMHAAVIYERLSAMERSANQRLDSIEERLARLEKLLEESARRRE
ncbi:MAG: glycosyltransferase family 2 protein [Chloroflexi bacterium]|nr:glycosyltransferase family 2 protein [Chloroflexota bacterium]